MNPLSHNSHLSHLSYQVAVDLGSGDSWSARQWYDTDGKPICHANLSEVIKVAEFFGYTTEQFDDLRPEIQVGMIRDHRRQMNEKEFASEVHSEGSGYGDSSENMTFKEAILTSVAFAILVAIIIYFFH